MTRSIDDIHSYDTRFIGVLNRIETLETSDENKGLIKKFVRSCRRQGLAKSTITNYVNLIFRMIANLKTVGYTGNLDKVDEDTFDDLLIHLEDIKKVSQGEVRNYKKLIKKFYRTMCEDEDDIPKWVRKLKLGKIGTQVQPGDIHTQDEISKLLEACWHPRDKAMIAVLFDGGLRVGAFASCKIKHVVFNKFGAVIYISNTSRCKKTAQAKGIPLTWSTGYLNQWLSVHPRKNDPEAPLWTSLNINSGPLSYNTINKRLKKIACVAGVNKPMNPHALRHTAITSWILDDLNDQAVKHRAAWARGSNQMMEIYANFADKQMNEHIYEKYGLKTEKEHVVKLDKCPRCHNVLKSTDQFCSQCGLVLDCRNLEKIKENEENIPELLKFLMENKSGQKLLDMLKTE